MSKGNLTGLVEKLNQLKISDDKKIAVIEQATTPYQKVYTSSFNDFEANFGSKVFASPSLVIIGKIVSLHEEFSWLENAEQEGLYFKSIENGSLIPTPQNFFEYAV
jgi:uroporphyrin-III C-methyltransferase/precorrin-2 dehydrogenase/sirohydrochlorin ferrochelatase